MFQFDNLSLCIKSEISSNYMTSRKVLEEQLFRIFKENIKFCEEMEEEERGCLVSLFVTLLNEDNFINRFQNRRISRIAIEFYTERLNIGRQTLEGIKRVLSNPSAQINMIKDSTISILSKLSDLRNNNEHKSLYRKRFSALIQDSVVSHSEKMQLQRIPRLSSQNADKFLHVMTEEQLKEDLENDLLDNVRRMKHFATSFKSSIQLDSKVKIVLTKEN